MLPVVFLVFIIIYFLFLFLVSWLSGRKADNNSYFLGNKKSPWVLVSIGMLSDSLSGVTFISVPGWVGTTQFAYLQLVFGYVVGYFVIARILLPLYYRLNLVSIYSYLNQRFGIHTQKTGSIFFIISRIVGAAFRLYLTASVLQLFIFDKWHVPFAVSVMCIIFLILIYTFKGGIKTLVYTDAIQSGFLVLGVILSIATISSQLHLGFFDIVHTVSSSPYSKVFFWDWHLKTFLVKEFLSGVFIAIVMTGLDQNMMQKNLSCRTLKSAQKNIYWFSGVMAITTVFFMSLGVLLYTYANSKNIALPVNAAGKPLTDHLFPMLALNYLGDFAAIAFIVGLTAATFASADCVLTTLTTSFCVDILGMKTDESNNEGKILHTRHIVHISFAVVLLLVILAFRFLNNDTVINGIFTAAGYTYGPLLGLFAFGLFTRFAIKDSLSPWICLISPVICFFLSFYSKQLFNGYEFGYELLILNGLLTFFGLLLISKKEIKPQLARA
jgi:solute:Na+ symporter, SSS family